MKSIDMGELCGVDDKDTMVDLMKQFLNFAQELLEKEIITQATYDEITYHKIKFLQMIEAELCLNEEALALEKTFSETLNPYM
ncbi:hypothetical protein QBE52_06620 [Clostridiaceae bacterium 35-E11]